MPETPTQRRRRVVRLAEDLARDQDGVVSRGQLRLWRRPCDRCAGMRADGSRRRSCATWSTGPERWRLVVEIEGIHHGRGVTQIADALRQNTLSLKRDTVLRIPLLGLRVAPDEFMAQVAEGLSTADAA